MGNSTCTSGFKLRLNDLDDNPYKCDKQVEKIKLKNNLIYTRRTKNSSKRLTDTYSKTTGNAQNLKVSRC